jgi:4-deoxy-L-threo-5-hexosulose-uronate ketol-isomerase
MKFDTRHASHQSIVQTADTARLREMFHVGGMFVPDDVSLTFSHIERMIVGGVMPVTKSVDLAEVPALNKGPFLARRELGIINVGGPGKVTVDGKSTSLAAREGLYVPMGTTGLSFSSDSAATPAKFDLASTPAHAATTSTSASPTPTATRTSRCSASSATPPL